MITSLAGRLPSRPDLPGETRVGGFGGVEGLTRYLRAEGIARVVDATHPFAWRVSGHAARACAHAGVPRLILIRPPWVAGPGDDWRAVADHAAAAGLLPTLARHAFLAIGGGELAAFSGLAAVHLVVRLMAPPAAPPPLVDHTLLIARPPADAADEIALLRAHRVEAVVSKNSGGPTTAKLLAARALGLPVIMIQRPPTPEGARVETVAEALAWLKSAAGDASA